VDEGVRQDFTEFVTARSAELLRLAYVLTADRHAAEDLLQNTPIQFRQVASISGQACRGGSPGLPGPATIPVGANPAGPNTCYRFTSKGMTVTSLKAARVAPSGQPGLPALLQFPPGRRHPVRGPDQQAGRPAQPALPARDYRRRAHHLGAHGGCGDLPPGRSPDRRLHQPRPGGAPAREWLSSAGLRLLRVHDPVSAPGQAFGDRLVKLAAIHAD